jgi:hypothetical protein
MCRWRVEVQCEVLEGGDKAVEIQELQQLFVHALVVRPWHCCVYGNAAGAASGATAANAATDCNSGAFEQFAGACAADCPPFNSFRLQIIFHPMLGNQPTLRKHQLEVCCSHELSPYSIAKRVCTKDLLQVRQHHGFIQRLTYWLPCFRGALLHAHHASTLVCVEWKSVKDRFPKLPFRLQRQSINIHPPCLCGIESKLLESVAHV